MTDSIVVEVTLAVLALVTPTATVILSHMRRTRETRQKHEETVALLGVIHREGNSRLTAAIAAAEEARDKASAAAKEIEELKAVLREKRR